MKRYLNIQTFGPWIAFIAVPLLVNGFVAAVFVTPQKTQLQAWHDAETLATLKPKLKELLGESHRIRVEESNQGAIMQDAQGAMQAIQKTAAQNSVQVIETRMQGQGEEGASMLPFELEVTGTFNKLARWVSDLESQKNFRIDSWALRPLPNQTLQLSVKMAVFVGGN